MKVARFLLAHALLLALAGAASAQVAPGPMPQGPVAMDAGAMMPGPSPYGPNGGEILGADCYPAPMAGGPVFGDCYPDNGPGGRLFKRTSRGYVQIDAMMLSRNDATGRVIAFNNGGATGTGTGVGTPIVRGSDPNFGFETLPRITAGYVLMNDIALEGTVWYKDDFDAIYDGFNPTGTTGRLSSNIFPFSSIGGVAGNRPSTFLDADLVNITNSTGIHSYELNVVETSRVFNFIAGFRYMEVRDQFQVISSDTSLTTGTGLAQFGTYNHLMGTQFGVKTGFTKGLATLDVLSKAGMYLNDAQSTTFIRDPTITPATQRYVRTAGQNEAFMAEFAVNLTIRVAASTALRLGYQCMFIDNVALAVDQINPTQSNQTGLSLNAHGDLFLHGPSAGLDFRW